MKKRIPLYAVVITVLFAVIITFQITYLSLWNGFYNKKAGGSAGIDGDSFAAIKNKLDAMNALYDEYYVGDIDAEELETGIMLGYVYGTGDKFGQYLDRETYAEFLDELDGETEGIGIMVIEDSATGLMEVVEVIPDTPAAKQGLRIGDLITAVEGNDAAQLGYYKALDMMRGKAGTQVSFTVYRDGEYVDFTIMREYVQVLSVDYRMSADGVTGIVRIISFDEPTPQQFKAAIDELSAAGAQRYVFDLRGNGGGMLESVTGILDYLLPEGPIIRITDRDGNVETVDSDASELDVPMAVLVNGNTASAAELFTAALRDYGKSVTVGTNTYGKGSMQTIIPLGDGTAVRVSIRMYSPPKSDNYDGLGIAPDIEVALDPELAGVSLYLIEEEKDNQLQAALDALNSSTK